MINRPQWHFTPKIGWINDPNGLCYDGTQYHLFAQHNPDDAIWGPMHWLHAVSDDLLHWHELGIALYPNALGTMFSGSMVIDERSTAGFGAGAMVAMFTQHGEVECQSIAHSLDGTGFTLYEGNPVISNPGIRDFRDPKVFWNDQKNCWSMVLAAGDHLEFYRSTNLKDWQKTGEFGAKENKLGHLFECPDLFQLALPEGGALWVLLASMGTAPEVSRRMQYFLGEFDGDTFHQTLGQDQVLLIDQGSDDYAGVTFSGTADRLFMGWAASPCYAGSVPADLFRGSMTLPRALSLVQTNAGPRLAAAPVLPELSYAPIQNGAIIERSTFMLRIHAESTFEIRLENAMGDCLKFGLDSDRNLYVDRSGAGASGFDPWYDHPAYGQISTQRLMDGAVDMQVIVDGYLSEFYADKGTYVNTTLVYPQQPYTSLYVSGQASIELASCP